VSELEGKEKGKVSTWKDDGGGVNVLLGQKTRRDFAPKVASLHRSESAAVLDEGVKREHVERPSEQRRRRGDGVAAAAVKGQQDRYE